MKILIADDDALSREFLSTTLTRWDYEVVSATDGIQAWEILQQSNAPDLAILDWTMPGLDGVEICRRVRDLVGGTYRYIILLSGKTRKEDVIAGMEAGVDDYLTKPIDPTELKVHLRAGTRIIDLQTRLLKSASRAQEAEDELAAARERVEEAGSRIQKALLLPPPPQNLPGGHLAALSIGTRLIDGDFYDFLKHNEHCFDILVGDVMGKGIPAALLAAALKSHFLRAIGHLNTFSEPGKLPEPEDIVGMVHSKVTRELINLQSFVTLCYARFNLERRSIDVVNCGHTPILHYQGKSRVCERLQRSDVALGFSETAVYRQFSVPVHVGDLLFFYSDGITEATNSNGEFFGLDRLQELVEGSSQGSPQEVIEQIVQAVIDFHGSSDFSDDLTCVSFKLEDVKALAHSRVDLTSELTHLGDIRSLVKNFCEQNTPLESEPIRQLSLATSEVAANVIKHAYHSDRGQPLSVELDVYPDRICVRVHHFGDTFDPAMVKPPPFDGSRSGGFGLYFIAQCVDEVHYLQDTDGRNTITLVKSLPEKASS